MRQYELDIELDEIDLVSLVRFLSHKVGCGDFGELRRRLKFTHNAAYFSTELPPYRYLCAIFLCK